MVGFVRRSVSELVSDGRMGGGLAVVSPDGRNKCQSYGGGGLVAKRWSERLEIGWNSHLVTSLSQNYFSLSLGFECFG
ncbi:hypothetical protein Hanom_Chr00s000003g01601511 [Helianthus anomalus]